MLTDLTYLTDLPIYEQLEYHPGMVRFCELHCLSNIWFPENDLLHIAYLL